MRVSVGIPFLNSESTIADAIRSVFAQTFQDWELILIDDGSSDRSLEIAMSIDDPRVRVISDGRNCGLQRRLNEIAYLSRGEYAARMDADDIMHPERLARQVDYLDANPFVDLVGTAIYTIDASNNPMSIRHTEPPDTRPGAILERGLMCHPTSMARTEWYRRNLYDETFVGAEDHELYCRTAPTSNFARLSEPLFYYRETHKDPKSYLRSYLLHAQFLRKCYKLYGPDYVGWWSTLRLISQSLFKSGVYSFATFVGAQDVVMKHRNGRPLSDYEMQKALDGLNRVAATQVPGLDRLT